MKVVFAYWLDNLAVSSFSLPCDFFESIWVPNIVRFAQWSTFPLCNFESVTNLYNWSQLQETYWHRVFAELFIKVSSAKNQLRRLSGQHLIRSLKV